MIALLALPISGYLLCFAGVQRMSNAFVSFAAKALLALAWFLSLASLVAINLDIYQTLRQPQPQPQTELLGLWRFFYWGSFFLGYIVFVVLGEREPHDRSSPLQLWVRFYRRRLRLFVCGGAAALLATLYLLWRGVLVLGSLDALPKLLTNTFGLLLIVLILGYSLPELPRKLWRRANPAEELSAALTKLALQKRALREREYGLEHALTTLAGRFGRAGDARGLALLRETARALPCGWAAAAVGDAEGRAADDPHVQLEETLDEAQEYARREQKLQRRARHARRLLDHLNAPPGRPRAFYLLWLRPLFFRALFALSSLLSLLILLLITANFLDAPRGVLLRLLRDCPSPLFFLALNGYLGYFGLLIVFGLARLKFQRFRGLTARGTDAQSLLHVTRHTLRMAIPLVVNLLQVLQLEDTQFSAVMGRPHFLPLMGDQLLRLFPALLLLLLLARLTDAYARGMRLLGLAEGCAAGAGGEELLREGAELAGGEGLGGYK